MFLADWSSLGLSKSMRGMFRVVPFLDVKFTPSTIHP